jgi:uncharacterized protein (DUF58 family)
VTTIRSITVRVRAAFEKVGRGWEDAANLRRWMRDHNSAVTPLGLSVGLLGVLAWLGGVELGWAELEIVAGACLALLAGAAAFTLGRADLTVDVKLDPPRVVVGDHAAGQVVVTNVAGRRLWPVPVELPVGAGLARFDIPTLAAGAAHEEIFVVPTNRRAVIPVGPATSVRGDPLGLLRREVEFSGMIELFVHPRTSRLETLGAGFLRDLEGASTDANSPSDLAFHSLRAYVPGDDRRHIHWKTTARMPSGDLMVRQFLDTRRSHIVVVLDGRSESYANNDEFELAVSAGASVAIRAIRDDQDATLVPGRQTKVGGGGKRILDGFSRVEAATRAPSLVHLSSYAAEAFTDASLVLLISGSPCELSVFRRARALFASDVRVLALVPDASVPSGIKSSSGLTYLSLADLDDLPRLLQGARLS